MWYREQRAAGPAGPLITEYLVHVRLATAGAGLGGPSSASAAHGIAIEGRTKWSRGGESVYFRDPDGHLLELATPGLWAIY